MSASDIFEVASSSLFLILGVWGTAYAYEFVGQGPLGRFQWNLSFKRHLRWVGPLLVVLCVASLLLIFR